MSKRKAILISNPHAGRGGKHRALEVAQFCGHLKERDVAVELVNTAGPGDACQLAARAAVEGWREVIVSGGDGTINEALQGIVGKNVRLAVWPRGTANVLAHELGLPFDTEEAASAVARGTARRLYPGCAMDEATETKRYFLLMAGIGLDASIVQRVDPRLKRRVGEAAFWYSGVEHLARWQPVPFDVEVNGENFSATFAAIGKAPRYGGNLAITPRVRCDEPQFEMCLVDSRSRLRYLYLLSHAMRRGVEDDMTSVHLMSATAARATGNAMVQADGELIGQLPMRFEVAPHPVEIIVP